MAKLTWRFSIGFGLVAACLAGAVGGCKKAPAGGTAESGSAAAQAEGETVARVHWLGIKRLTGLHNAGFFVSTWNFPQSKRLEEQTLDKLALALASGWPVRSNWFSNLPSSPPGDTNHNPSSLIHLPLPSGSTALLRPLLEDLVQEESYSEVRQATNQAGETALLIRLDEARARAWETNLLAALEALTGNSNAAVEAGTYGWRLDAKSPSADQELRVFTLSRAGDWTVLGLAPGTNALAADLAARIRHQGLPFALPPTNYWLDASVDAERLAGVLGLDWKIPAALPKISLSAIGNADENLANVTGEHIRVLGDLEFAKPLALDLEPWKIPTDLISGPVDSFAALRGFQPWLSSWRSWTSLGVGPAANQIFLWGQHGMPFLSYGAAPLTKSNEFEAATAKLVKEGNQWMLTHAMGNLVNSTNFDGVVWKGHPFLLPYLKRVATNDGAFALWGWGGKPVPKEEPLPSGLLEQVKGHTNLVYYDWELTGPRLDEWGYMGQLVRRMFHKSHMAPDSAGTEWLRAIESRLGNCGTMVTVAGPNRLEFRRNSGLGLCSVELEWLADWLESPQFPHGLHSTLAPEPVVPLTVAGPGAGQQGTNAPRWAPTAAPAK